MSNNTKVEELVRNWLTTDGRRRYLLSDVTRALATNRRTTLKKLSPRPREAILDALRSLEQDGLLSLSPTTNRRGRPGTEIKLIRKEDK